MKHTNASVARRVGMKADEILKIEETPEGLLIVTTDGAEMIDVPADRPDAGGKTGLMLRRKPSKTYNGDFPVYADTAEVDEPDAEAALVDEPVVDELAPIRELLEAAVEDGDFDDLAAAVEDAYLTLAAAGDDAQVDAEAKRAELADALTAAEAELAQAKTAAEKTKASANLEAATAALAACDADTEPASE